jgi:hypothetical protein
MITVRFAARAAAAVIAVAALAVIAVGLAYWAGVT